MNHQFTPLHGDPAQPSSIEEAVLAAVREIVAEAHPDDDRDLRVTLDSLIEAELELFSLERVELAIRLAAQFPAALPEHAIVSAESVRDLVVAIAGTDAIAEERRPEARTPPSAEASPSTTRAAGSWLYQAWVLLLLFGATIMLWPTLNVVLPGPRSLRVIRGVARWLFTAAGIRVTATGLERLSGVAPAVLLANHESYLDSAVLVAVLPAELTFVVNERLPNAPLIGPLIQAGRCIVVDRNSVAQRIRGANAIESALRRGHSLCLFPEGTFTAGPELLPFRLGGFAAAVELQRPIVPITLNGTRRVLPDGAWRLSSHAVSVTIHEPIFPRERGFQEALRMRSEVRRQIESARI